MKLKHVASFGLKALLLNSLPALRIPITVYIAVTNKCNNRCVYCSVKNLPQDDFFSTGDLKIVLRQMKDCGTLRVHFTGGEPMMRDDLGELINFAKSLGLFVGVSTNGYNISKRIKELEKVDVVFLSYDGPDHIHSKLRGERSVGDVASALKALKSSGIRVWTTTVINKLNLNFINEILSFAEEHGILANFTILEFINEKAVCLHPSMDEIRDILPGISAIREGFRELIRLKKLNKPVGSSYEYLRNVAEWQDFNSITSTLYSKRYRCWAGRAFCHLEADGRLYACGWGVLKRQGGLNVLKDGFSACWNRITPLIGCNSCSHACGVENNLILSLNSSAITNAISGLIKH